MWGPLALVIPALAGAFTAGVRPMVLPNDIAMIATLAAPVGVKVLMGALAMGRVFGRAVGSASVARRADTRLGRLLCRGPCPSRCRARAVCIRPAEPFCYHVLA